jgi:hypothetical protein
VRTPFLGLLIVVPGCASPPGGWNSPDPAARLTAINDAAKTNDRSAIPHLIESLQHDDPVVRMWAIRTLEQMTGQTLGYDYAAPEWERRDRIAAWVDWYKGAGRASDNVDRASSRNRWDGPVGPIEAA